MRFRISTGPCSGVMFTGSPGACCIHPSHSRSASRPVVGVDVVLAPARVWDWEAVSRWCSRHDHARKEMQFNPLKSLVNRRDIKLNSSPFPWHSEKFFRPPKDTVWLTVNKRKRKFLSAHKVLPRFEHDMSIGGITVRVLGYRTIYRGVKKRQAQFDRADRL